MLYPICLSTNETGMFTAFSPDLPDTQVENEDRQRTLTKVHLRMEKAVSDLILDNQPVPEPSSKTELDSRPECSHQEIVEIDINPVHLAAVARHQGRK